MMPFLERIWNNGLPVSVSLCGLAVTIAVVAALLQRHKQARRLDALGSRASAYPSKLPFGKWVTEDLLFNSNVRR